PLSRSPRLLDTSLLSTPTLSTAPPPTPSYTLSLHDALPIYLITVAGQPLAGSEAEREDLMQRHLDSAITQRLLEHEGLPIEFTGDRKSTRLNSSHGSISYAVFCLKKKKITTDICHTLN